MKETGKIGKALRAAFPHTLPILAGFSFLGITYGIYMKVSGFGLAYSVLISLLVFAGSMQFVGVQLLLGAFNPVQALAMTLMINARHLFYGLSMLEKYRDTGRKKPYLIFAMCDETFSVNCSAEIPPDVDRGWFYFFVSLLDQSYWVLGTAAGAMFGSLITFNTKGLDFCMTAMFVVIFLEQWLKTGNHINMLAGLGISVLCLAVFGPEDFIIPAMFGVIGVLTLLRGTMKTKEEAA